MRLGVSCKRSIREHLPISSRPVAIPKVIRRRHSADRPHRTSQSIHHILLARRDCGPHEWIGQGEFPHHSIPGLRSSVPIAHVTSATSSFLIRTVVLNANRSGASLHMAIQNLSMLSNTIGQQQGASPPSASPSAKGLHCITICFVNTSKTMHWLTGIRSVSSYAREISFVP